MSSAYLKEQWNQEKDNNIDTIGMYTQNNHWYVIIEVR